MTLSVISDREFVGLRDTRLPGRKPRVIEDMRVQDCRFVDCHLSATRNVRKRAVVRRVELVNCELESCYIGPIVAEDVTIDGIRSLGKISVWAPALKHVAISGRVGRVQISRFVAPTVATASETEAFLKANAEFYAETDWALDVSAVDALELDIRGVPGHLVRINPETQVVVWRQRLLETDWRKNSEIMASGWAISLEDIEADGLDSTVLAACERDPHHEALQRGLDAIVDAGLTNPP